MIRVEIPTTLVAIALALATPACTDGDTTGAGPDTSQGDTSAGPTSTTDASAADSTAPEDPLALLYASVGGADVLAAFTSVSYDASGSQNVHSEGRVPGEIIEANTFESQIWYVHEGRHLRADEVRDTQFPFAFPRMFSRVLEGAKGWTGGVEGVPGVFPSGDVEPDKAAGHAWMQELLVPHILLRRALDGEFGVQSLGSLDFGGTPHEAFGLDVPGSAVEAFVEPSTGRLSGLAITAHDTLLCDKRLEVHFSNWVQLGGYDFPAHVELRGYGGTMHVEDRSNVELDGVLAADVFAFPPEATLPQDDALATIGRKRFPYYYLTSAMGVPFSLNQTSIDATALAPGVFFVAATHNSLVVEQQDGVIVVEAPLDGQRSQAILDWVALEFPGKPVSHTVVTHHHLDHAGGLRRFVAEGSSIVLAQQGEDFFRNEVLAGQCAVLPDALAQGPREADIVSVPSAGSTVFDDVQNPVVTYQVETEHAQDMLLVYLPNQGILFNSDLYNPLPKALQGMADPYFRPAEILDLAAGLETFGVMPTIMAGGHGGVTTWAQFVVDLAALEG